MFKRKSNQIDYTGRPSICPTCGALIGSGESSCAQCGSPTSSNRIVNVATGDRYDRETMRFARAVLSRPYIFTIIFLIVNFFIFFLMWSSSASTAPAVLSFPESTLITYGSKLNWLVNEGQWWRLVTPVFIHVGVIHLLVNMYSLWIVGPYVEKLYGSAKFVVFWVMTGIAGVFASYLTVRPGIEAGALGRFVFKLSDTPSAGASGALFGLVGVLFVFGIKFRKELPAGFQRAFGTGLLPTILINLFIGYLGEGFIDNAAHLGGFVSGALIALGVDYEKPGTGTRVALFWRVLQIGSLALVAISFVMIARHFNDPVAGSPQLASYTQALNDGQGALLRALNGEEVETLQSVVGELQNTPAPDAKAKNLLDQLRLLILRAKDNIPAKGADRGAQFLVRQKMILSDFDAWQRNLQAWMDVEGKKYKLGFKDPSKEQAPSKA